MYTTVLRESMYTTVLRESMYTTVLRESMYTSVQREKTKVNSLYCFNDFYMVFLNFELFSTVRKVDVLVLSSCTAWCKSTKAEE